jgi:hypothetical protein
MHLRPGYFLLLAASLLVPASLRAQQQTLSTPDNQEMDVAVTYTEQHRNLVSTPTFWLPGGSVELSAQVYHGLGLAANVTGNTVTFAANSGGGLSMVTANFGPRFTFYRPAGAGRKHSLAIFGRGLIGQAWGFNSYFLQPRECRPTTTPSRCR